MSREIKFRVWDKDNKKMYPVLQLFMSCNKSYPQVRIDNDDQNDITDWLILNNCILQQFTGLKDKNDKDIYEGDIVEFKDNCFCYNTTVNFSGGAFRIGLALLENNNLFSTIIGNIFANPELLKNAV